MRSAVVRAANAVLCTSAQAAAGEPWAGAAAAATCCRAATSAHPVPAGDTNTCSATQRQQWQHNHQQQQQPWNWGRGFFTTSPAAHADGASAAAPAAVKATRPPRQLTPRKASPSQRSVPQQLESMSFEEIRDWTKSMTVTNPLAEGKMLLLVQRAASPSELEEALALVRINRLRATRMRQYCPFTPYMPNALLQTAKRVGAPPSFYVTLLKDASLLGLPISTHVVEESLIACATDAAAFDRAWLLARAHQPRVSKHAVFIAVRTLAGFGRRKEAIAAVLQFEEAGGQLSPSLQRWLEEAKQKQQEEDQQRLEARAAQKKEGEGEGQQPEGGSS